MSTDDASTTERNDRALANALLGGGLRQGELLDAPQRIDRYELGERIGEGATSEVFRARDTALDRVVAIKLLRGLHEDPIRFKREMQILGALQHPNIVRIFDGGTLGARPYYAMELIEGRPLNQAGLEREAAVEAVEQAALACHSAHQQDIVHRDLKPANILLAEDGRAVVADFGVAKVLGSTRTQHTEPGSILGTPRYMAPEQWDGETVDPRTDVYALGVILFELLTGAPPFTGTTLSELGGQIVNKPPPSPRELDPTIPERLEQIVLTALAKRPDARQPTALVLAKQLAAWRRGDAPEAETIVAARPRPESPAREVRVVAGAAVILLGLVAGGAALAFRTRETPATEPDVAAPLPPPSAGPPQETPEKTAPLAFLTPIRQQLRGWREARIDASHRLDLSVPALAENRLEAALKLTVSRFEPPQRREALLVLASALEAQGRSHEALQRLDQAIEVPDGDAPFALFRRAHLRFEAWFLLELCDVPTPEADDDDDDAPDPGELALTDLRTALKQGLELPWQRHLAAVVFDLLRGDHDEVAASLERLAEANPELASGELDLLRGRAAILRGAHHRATPFLTRAARSQGTAVRARLALTFAGLEQDRPGRALVPALEALEAAPDSAHTTRVLAAALRGVRMSEVAPDAQLDVVNRLLRLLTDRYRADRNDLTSLQALGAVYVVRALRDERVRKRALRQGLEVFRRALKLDPASPVTLLSLSYANKLAAQHLEPTSPFRRAAWTGLQRLQRLGPDVATHDEVEELGALFAKEIPLERPGGDDR